MNAPVAAKMPKRELAAKNISSGPRSSTSLRAGLSFGLLVMRWDLARSSGLVIGSIAAVGLGLSRFHPRNGPRKILRLEPREIVDAFADPDEMHRQGGPVRKRAQDSASDRPRHDRYGH